MFVLPRHRVKTVLIRLLADSSFYVLAISTKEQLQRQSYAPKALLYGRKDFSLTSAKVRSCGVIEMREKVPVLMRGRQLQEIQPAKMIEIDFFLPFY